MPLILQAAHDIAAGMSVLHARNVVHGDLTGGNILLASHPESPSGVLAKIADFGLARTMDVQSKIETRAYGTVTHMPPELLVKGILSKVGSQLFPLLIVDEIKTSPPPPHPNYVYGNAQRP